MKLVFGFLVLSDTWVVRSIFFRQMPVFWSLDRIWVSSLFTVCTKRFEAPLDVIWHSTNKWLIYCLFLSNLCHWASVEWDKEKHLYCLFCKQFVRILIADQVFANVCPVFWVSDMRMCKDGLQYIWNRIFNIMKTYTLPNWKSHRQAGLCWLMVKPAQQKTWWLEVRHSSPPIGPQYKCVWIQCACVYLVIWIKLRNEAFPVSKIVVYSVKSCYIYVCQNPPIATFHLRVHHCWKVNNISIKWNQILYTHSEEKKKHQI